MYHASYIDRVLQDNPELLAPVNYNEIRALTASMHQQISLGTLDAPSWRMIRNAKLAACMYAPLGTTMSLGDYVRVVRTFQEAFKLAERPISENQSGSECEVVIKEHGNAEGAQREDEKIRQLGDDLKVLLTFPLYASPDVIGHRRIKIS